MLTQARANNAPRLDRAQAAHALGADPARLDAALTGRADAAQDTRTRTGLRADQAAAALSVLTDGQRASVIIAPAAGKTRVLTDTGRAWTEAGLGPVVGITASQSARNTLAAGVPVSDNAAQFLGHLPGRRGARGPVETGPAPLPEPVAALARTVLANRKGHASIGARQPSPWLFPGGQPGRPISTAQLTSLVDQLGTAPARTAAPRCSSSPPRSRPPSSPAPWPSAPAPPSPGNATPQATGSLTPPTSATVWKLT